MDAVASFVRTILLEWDNQKKAMHCTLLDLKKTFATVDHIQFLENFYNFGVPVFDF